MDVNMPDVHVLKGPWHRCKKFNRWMHVPQFILVMCIILFQACLHTV